MESVIGHRIDYNGVEALRAQRHIPSKKLTEATPRGSSVHLFSEEKLLWIIAIRKLMFNKKLEFEFRVIQMKRINTSDFSSNQCLLK